MSPCGGRSKKSIVALSPSDQRIIAEQLQRSPRSVLGVAHRCPCGNPDVVRTAPRLTDGTPFPTLYYLTCPRLASAIGRLESEGVMREMEDLIASDAQVAAAYRQAHDDYLQDRERDGVVPEIAGISAGGMPDRVKCLHVLVAHSLAAGNPIGDLIRERLEPWWTAGSCVSEDS
jgi:hypothetical protein